MKIINEREWEKKTRRSGASYSESVRAKWFCCVWNLELALSIILKERELY